MRSCIDWDLEKTALIRQLYLTHSAGMIARELADRFRGCFTRNSVAGKIDRLGLRKDGMGKLPPVNLRVPNPDAAKPKHKRVKIKPQPKPPRLVFESPPTNGIACPCQLDELGRFNCRWGIGDPAQPGFYFCGAVVIPGKPYCPTHDALSHHAETGRQLPPAQAARIASFRRAAAPWGALIGDLRQAAFRQAAQPGGFIHEPT